MAHFHVSNHPDGFELHPDFFLDELSPKEREEYKEIRQAFGTDDGIVVEGNFEDGESVAVGEVWARLTNYVVIEEVHDGMLFHPDFHSLSSDEKQMWEMLETVFPDRKLPHSGPFEHNEFIALDEFFRWVGTYYRRVINFEDN